MLNANELKQKYDLNNTQANMVKAMVLGGAQLESALDTVAGYRGTKDTTPNSLTCTRCRGTMKVVSLYDGRRARYCPKDRVTLPLKHNS